MDKAMLSQLPKLEIIANMGAGFESIEMGEARAHGVIVTNAGGVNAVDVAEFTIGLLLSVSRAILIGDRYIRAGNWASMGRMAMTHRVSGRPMGIIGLGNIGCEIAKRAAAFDMPVLYHNRRARNDVAYPYVADIAELARQVDFLVVATPGGPATRHLVDGRVLDALGQDGILINIARGSVVDQAALIDALTLGKIAGAGLDVFDGEPNVPAELIALSNVVLQPHQAGATIEGVEAAMDLAVRNLRAHFAGQPVLTPVR
jgi:lactate dehydrogenase-like 2-hydroxyacid dehydrogenase